MNLAERTKITFKLEQRRAISSGILEAAGSTFLLLTVIRGCLLYTSDAADE